MVYFIIGCNESVSDLGYCEDIKPMICCTRTSCCVLIVVKIIGDELKEAFHRAFFSSDSASVNSIVDTLAYFSKSNIVEYDNESPSSYRTSTRTRDLVI